MTQTTAMDAAGKKEIYDICVVYGELKGNSHSIMNRRNHSRGQSLFFPSARSLCPEVGTRRSSRLTLAHWLERGKLYITLSTQLSEVWAVFLLIMSYRHHSDRPQIWLPRSSHSNSFRHLFQSLLFSCLFAFVWLRSWHDILDHCPGLSTRVVYM